MFVCILYIQLQYIYIPWPSNDLFILGLSKKNCFPLIVLFFQSWCVLRLFSAVLEGMDKQAPVGSSSWLRKNWITRKFWFGAKWHDISRRNWIRRKCWVGAKWFDISRTAFLQESQEPYKPISRQVLAIVFAMVASSWSFQDGPVTKITGWQQFWCGTHSSTQSQLANLIWEVKVIHLAQAWNDMKRKASIPRQSRTWFAMLLGATRIRISNGSLDHDCPMQSNSHVPNLKLLALHWRG